MSPEHHDLARLSPYACRPLDGVLTAGQPSEAQVRRLAEAGYRTLVDLRPSEEPRGFDEAAAARAAGIGYVHVPVTAATLDDAAFDAIRALLRDPTRRPVVVHCATANRVGAVLVPYLALDEHLPLAEAVSLARQIGLRSPEMTERAVAYVERRAEE